MLINHNLPILQRDSNAIALLLFDKPLLLCFIEKGLYRINSTDNIFKRKYEKVSECSSTRQKVLLIVVLMHLNTRVKKGCLFVSFFLCSVKILKLLYLVGISPFYLPTQFLKCIYRYQLQSNWNNIGLHYYFSYSYKILIPNHI